MLNHHVLVNNNQMQSFQPFVTKMSNIVTTSEITKVMIEPTNYPNQAGKYRTPVFIGD